MWVGSPRQDAAHPVFRLIKKSVYGGTRTWLRSVGGGYYPLDVILRKLSFDSGDAGEDFTLNGFEQCAATGRYVRNFVGEAEFVYASNGVAAANE